LKETFKSQYIFGKNNLTFPMGECCKKDKVFLQILRYHKHDS
jgi:hypothetical protein